MAEDRPVGWRDAGTAVLLSLAGLTSAWASYQSSLWDGEQAHAYTIANGLLTEAASLDLVVGQQDMTDRVLFFAWLNAAAGNDQLRMRFFENRFEPEMRAPFAAWRAQLPDDVHDLAAAATAAPTLPMLKFDHPEAARARALRAKAQTSLAQGDAANGHGDRYGAATVLLSLVLFLGGISPILRQRRAQSAVLGIAALLGVAALLWVISLPVATL